MTTFFTARLDALLGEWLSSPNWHKDRPSGNAPFYRFAAALMQELGCLDIREVQGRLEEAGRAWATDYDGCHGDARVQALCERLQVLYDFFGAIKGPTISATEPGRTLPLPSPHTPMPQQSGQQVTACRAQDDAAPSPPALVMGATLGMAERATPLPSGQDDRIMEADKAPKRRGGRARKTPVGQSDERVEGPSHERWAAYWQRIVRLYPLLMERRGEPLPPRVSGDNPEAVFEEMQRWAREVLHAEEITGAEKRDLITTVIDKVCPHKREDGTVFVEIEWLR